MKRHVRVVTLLAALTATSGCQDDFLTEVPSDFVAPQTFYTSAENAIAAVNAAYATFVNLQSPLGSSDYVGRNLYMLVEYPTEVTTSRLSTANERSLIGNFNAQFTSSHPYLETVWQAAYAGINRANSVIERVPEVPMNETRRPRSSARPSSCARCTTTGSRGCSAACRSSSPRPRPSRAATSRARRRPRRTRRSPRT
jgi:hypothetical protein